MFAELAQKQAAHFAQLRAARPAPAPKAAPVVVAKVDEPAHIEALRAALPIVQRAAAVRPTVCPGRIQRQHEAAMALAAIRAALDL